MSLEIENTPRHSYAVLVYHQEQFIRKAREWAFPKTYHLSEIIRSDY